MEDFTWLPEWANSETRAGLSSPVGCRCSAFCRYYATGEGSKPSLRDICPLYFRDRPLLFYGSFRIGAIDFHYCPWHALENKSLFIRFDNFRVFFAFGWRRDFTEEFREEQYTLFADASEDLYEYSPRRPLKPANLHPELNILETLENLLSPIVVSDTAVSLID